MINKNIKAKCSDLASLVITVTIWQRLRESDRKFCGNKYRRNWSSEFKIDFNTNWNWNLITNYVFEFLYQLFHVQYVPEREDIRFDFRKQVLDFMKNRKNRKVERQILP